MNILVIDSSSRSKGNTREIIETFLEELKKKLNRNNADLYVERIHLSEQDLHFCKGCRLCFDKGENYCPNKDGLLAISARIMKADSLVIASPVYLEDVNAIMKNWLDRMSFNSHRPKFFGKSATIITTSGGGASKHALRTMKNALTSFGIITLNCGNFICGNGLTTKPVPVKNINKLEIFAQKIIKHHYSNMNSRPSFYALLVFSIQKRYWKTNPNKDGIDYKYWYENGWLEDKSNYYYEIDTPKTKIYLSNLVGRLISRVFY